MRNRSVTLGLLLSLGIVTSVSAAVTGTLNVLDCAGGGVTVTATSVDWLLPAGGSNGCLLAGVGTNVSFAAGVLLPPATGSIKDLSAGDPFPVVDFMTFSGFPTLSFDLSVLGPGSPNTACSTSTSPGTVCSVFPGSPFILTPNGTGTTVSLPASGVARDGTGVNAIWSGEFTFLFPNLAPADIQDFILGASNPNIGFGCVVGSCTVEDEGIFIADVSATAGPGYRASFTMSAVPEPHSLFLGGAGLFLSLAHWRKRRPRAFFP